MEEELKMDITAQLDAFITQGYSLESDYVYVLELEENKYYIGQSKNYVKRILKHTDKYNEQKWTKKYKPLKILELIHNKEFLERDKTLEYMRLYGWENVRGGPWVKMVITRPKML